MHLKEQTYIVTLARAGSISKAAELLYISQPALSLYLSTLEKSLGTKLFRRDKGRMVPTPAGELYVEKAAQMLALQDEFNQELQFILNKRIRRLRVGMQTIRSGLLSGPVISRFWDTYPDVHLIWEEGVYRPLEEALRQNHLDLFFCNRQTLKPDLTYRVLYEDEILFIANKNNPLCRHAIYTEGEPYPWIDLTLFKDARFLLTTPTQSTRFAADIILNSVGLSPSQVIPISRIYTIYSLIRLDRGVSFTSSKYLPPDYLDQDIMAFRVGTKQVSLEFCAIYLNGQTLPEPAESLITWMKEEIQKPHIYYR